MATIRDLATGQIARFDSSGDNMRVTATIRHKGVLSYLQQDGTLRNELVTTNLLRHVDADTGLPLINGIKHRPVTNEHPPIFIRDNTQYSDAFGKGLVLPKKMKVFSDGETEIQFEVSDRELQDAIASGEKKGVSLGYECGSKPVNKRIDGVFIHSEQTLPFVFDHVAVCRHPRAKSALIKRFDSIQMEGDDIAFHFDAEPPTKKTFYMGGRRMATITLGGATHQVEDSGLASAVQTYVDKIHTDMDDMKKKLKEEEEGHTDAVNRHNDLVDQYNDLEGRYDALVENPPEKKTDASVIESSVAERLDSWAKVAKIAGASSITTEGTPFEVKNDALCIDPKLDSEAIYRGYLATRTDSDLSGKPAAYIEARIDAYLESGAGSSTDSTGDLKKVLDSSRPRTPLPPNQKIHMDAKRRQDAMRNMTLGQALEAHTGGNR